MTLIAEEKKTTLAELLKKDKGKMISIIKNKIAVTHIEGKTFNGDVELKSGDKYQIRIKDKWEEKTV